jgi:hypothetical protein
LEVGAGEAAGAGAGEGAAEEGGVVLLGEALTMGAGAGVDSVAFVRGLFTGALVADGVDFAPSSVAVAGFPSEGFSDGGVGVAADLLCTGIGAFEAAGAATCVTPTLADSVTD